MKWKIMKWQMMEWHKKFKALYNQCLLLVGQCDICGNSLKKSVVSAQAMYQQTMLKQTAHQKALPLQTLLCSSCLADLPLFKQDILQGDLLNWPAINKALPNSYFDHLICLSPYLPPFTQWLPQFKYQGRFELASLFSNLLATLFIEELLTHYISPIDLVLSVPLHSRKWQIRGYNQAHLLAKPLANYLQLPYDEKALIRTKNNISQVGQTGSQRRKNLANAFRLAKNLPCHIKHVMLVDDVLTTGSTANEISKVLKRAGVNRVTVATVCLTLPKANN